MSGASNTMASANLPAVLRTLLLAAATASAAPRSSAAEWRPGPDTSTIRFAGQDWFVKDSAGQPVGPGPNVFDARNVTVQAGKLHLRIGRQGVTPTSAEIISRAPFGYGKYTFVVENDPADLDRNVVLGLFTWSDDPAYNHREIDIEISRWGDAANDNAQCVVQPYDLPGDLVRFALPGGLKQATYTFTWQPEAVSCAVAGNATTEEGGKPANFRFAHRFTERIPVPDGQHARINLWLFGARPPASNTPPEVVVAGFDFTPDRRAGKRRLPSRATASNEGSFQPARPCPMPRPCPTAPSPSRSLSIATSPRSRRSTGTPVPQPTIRS